MGSLVLAGFLSLWILVSISGGTSISKQPFKLFITNCQTESGATKDDFENIKMRKLPETKSGRCFLECLFTKVKLMSNGKFNKQGMVLAFAPSTKGDPTKLRKLKELADICDEEIGEKKAEDCDGVKLIVECVAKHGKEYGVQFSKPKK